MLKLDILKEAVPVAVCRFFHYLQKFICLHRGLDKKSTALSFRQQLISITDEIILKIAKNSFKFADLSYSIRFQWHRL